MGFRPFIFQIAAQEDLKGEIRNTSEGVDLTLQGSVAALTRFESRLHDELPPLARIDDIEAEPVGHYGYTQFSILESRPQAGAFTPVPADSSICPDCRRELFDPSNRRFRYPFINCTNCGPRFTIIHDVPYDRPKTSMADFALCEDCAREYRDPLDRRYHAQPIACAVCGPRIRYQNTDGSQPSSGEEALRAARRLLGGGGILAIKGLGGFHLACDASNSTAVKTLRARKHRSDKPFALMAFDLAKLRAQVQSTAEDESLLTSPQAPAVILPLRPESTISPAVAPGQRTAGVMLAYTPLHLLLLEPQPGFPDIFVMTSGNLSEEPIAYDDQDGLTRLADLADGFLLHDRPILMRMDDSVIASASPHPIMYRRSRGYAPDPLPLPLSVPSVLAAGAEVKNTFCLCRENYAFVSHHIGDMENEETLRSFEAAVSHYERFFRIAPAILACDLHPDYLASRYALERSQRENLPLVKVQHHHAHLSACLAENGWLGDEPVIGLIFDGSGLGWDRQIWGGEVLTGGYRNVQRSFHLRYTPLPGGEAAIRKPARMALSWLHTAGISAPESLPCLRSLTQHEITVLERQLDGRIPTLQTSSMGRLFDAAAALIGLRQVVTYEGQAAIEMEAIAEENSSLTYPFTLAGGVLDPSPMFAAILDELRKGVPPSLIAAGFHNTVAEMACRVCDLVSESTGFRNVALSGGVWQNRRLSQHVFDKLASRGYTVLSHKKYPPNDGCLALGQAMTAAMT